MEVRVKSGHPQSEMCFNFTPYPYGTRIVSQGDSTLTALIYDPLEKE